MIRQESLNEVYDAMHIEEIVGMSVDLKKRGASLIGLCPFHDEKTPSFHVNPAKGIYKCFGCGKGGNAINFLMEHDRLNFPDAVRKVAERYSIRLQMDRTIEENQEAEKSRLELFAINKAAARQYQNLLMGKSESPHASAALLAKEYFLSQRRFTEDTIIQWQLGFAPDEWKFLTTMLVEKGIFKPAEELGLVRTSNESNYDFFRNRVMFPIHDIYGNVVAFGGRDMGTKEEQKKQNIAKYINSPESPIFIKSKTLYGIYFAYKAIRKEKYAILVEGYTDVISFHQYGAENTVATCGTALTDDHAHQLKKYCDHIVIIRDGDAAGTNAMIRDIDILLKHGFKTDVVSLPEGEDPDSYASKFKLEEEQEEITNH